MTLLPILHGYCTIGLTLNISGNNFDPVYKVVDNTLVDEKNFLRLNRYKWGAQEIKGAKSYRAVRVEWQGGKLINVYMARDVLNLPHGVGFSYGVGDHINKDTRDNREDNLRHATQSQNARNVTKNKFSKYRFGGYYEEKSGGLYTTRIRFSGLRVFFQSVLIEIEAGLMYQYAAIILHDKFACIEDLPEDGMPSRGRKWELFGMVVKRLSQIGLI